MKQTMIDMMSAMMTYMKLPIFWLGVPALVLGATLLILKLALSGYKTPVGHSKWAPAILGGRLTALAGLTIASWILIILGVFYIGCQGLGYILGMSPKINFGDPSKFEFITYEFWKIGLVFLVPGIIYSLFKGGRS